MYGELTRDTGTSNLLCIESTAPHSVTVMSFDAKPATRFCTQLCLDSMRPELLRRRYGESDNDDDFEGNGMESSEGDGEVDVEGEGE